MLKKPGLDRDDIIQFAPKTLAFRKGEGNIPGKDGILDLTKMGAEGALCFVQFFRVCPAKNGENYLKSKKETCNIVFEIRLHDRSKPKKG